MRKQQEVRPQHSGDSAACAYHGDHGLRIRKGISIGGRNAGKEIKEEEPGVPERIFNIVAEDPEVKHVSCNVKEPPVQEHGGNDAQRRGNGLRPLKGDDIVRNSAVEESELLSPQGCYELPDKYQAVYCNQPDRNKGERLCRIIIFIGDHSLIFCRQQGMHAAFP